MVECALPVRLLALISLYFSSATASLLAADRTQISPRGTFTIAQHYGAEEWITKLHFATGRHADITLEDSYSWPALFYISPDEEWILQVQKTAGDNTAILSRLERNFRLTRVEKHVDQLGFAFLARVSRISLRDLYHTGIAFLSWDLKARLLRFTIHGSYVDRNGQGVERALAYSLNDHAIVAQSSSHALKIFR